MAGHRDRAELLPGLAVCGRAFHPAGPGPVALDGAAGQDGTAVELDRLVLDWTEQAGGKLFWLAPRLAFIRRATDIARPSHWVGTGLVKKKRRLTLAAKEHRVPARKAGLLGGYFGLRPGVAIEPGQPD